MKSFNYQLIILLAFFGAIAGGIFASLTVEMSWRYFIYGASDGAWIGGLMAAYTLLASRGRIGRKIRAQSFGFKVIFNSSIYVLLFFVGRYRGHILQGRAANLVWDTQFYSSLAYAVIIALLVNFIMEMSLLVGAKAVWNFVRGTYHRPLEEDRVFMFIDLASSTTIAEKLGNRKFMELLNLFFAALSDAAVETNAEIYKYVGDEAILTWTTKNSCQKNNALECFFRFQANLKNVEAEFVEKFEVLPAFRGALHRGHVISGELGVSRKEIAYLGDVVNTTARLMETAREHSELLVVSQDFLDEYEGKLPEDFQFNSLAFQSLRGRNEQVAVFGVRK